MSAPVLFVGGPVDGQWREVEAAGETITVQLTADAMSLADLPDDAPVPTRTATYRRRVNFARELAMALLAAADWADDADPLHKRRFKAAQGGEPS